MRTSNSIKNSVMSLITNIVAMIVSFFNQAIFVRVLGTECLGLNGLFTNIVTMLGIVELGIGNAIVFNLYKPIAENNIKQIKSLMGFYKKTYRIIALVILLLGILILPLLKIIVGEINININIYMIFILFIISTISSYLMSYKRNIIIANQKNYIINIIHLAYILLLNISQIIVIYITKNFYLYLIIKIICQIIENIIITMYANKKYNFLLEKESEKLDVETERDIFSRVKALVLHKIGGIVINGTDNILISTFFNITTVGLYTNYHLILNAVSTLFGQMITSSTAVVGNYVITETKEKQFIIFKKIRFINFWIAAFASTCVLVTIQPFMEIWMGKKYLLGLSIVIVLVFNLFQKMMRYTYATFKDSAGIWREDKLIPIFESVLNILFSIVLLKMFGLIGVFIGTIISGLALWCYSYPRFIYKGLLRQSYINYIKETIGYILLFVIISSVTYSISCLVTFENIYIQVINNVIICLLVPNLLIIILFYKNENFKYIISLIKRIIRKAHN